MVPAHDSNCGPTRLQSPVALPTELMPATWREFYRIYLKTRKKQTDKFNLIVDFYQFSPTAVIHQSMVH